MKRGAMYVLIPIPSVMIQYEMYAEEECKEKTSGQTIKGQLLKVHGVGGARE